VGRAEAGGAPAVPDAKLHLQLAQEDLQKGKALIGNDNKRAATLIVLCSRRRWRRPPMPATTRSRRKTVSRKKVPNELQEHANPT
jgi:hypothetical protein